MPCRTWSGCTLDLLDVGSCVDDLDYQIRDRPIVGVDRDKSPPCLGVRCQLLDGARIVVGHQIHAEGTKGLGQAASCNVGRRRSPTMLHKAAAM